MISLVRFLLRHKIIRYIISGGTATGTHLLLLFVFTDIFEIWYLVSTTLAFLVSFWVSFTLQKFWTFGDTRVHVFVQQVIYYFVTATSMLVLNAVFMYALVDLAGVWYMFAQVIASGTIALFNFFIYNMFIFQKNDDENIKERKMISPIAGEYAAPARFSGERVFRVYIGALFPRLRPLLLLGRQLDLPNYKGQKPFRTVYEQMDFSFLQLTDDPSQADFFLLPHSVFSACAEDMRVVLRFVSLAKHHRKKVVLFAEGDSDTSIPVPHALVFRTSQYAHKKLPNEIMMPPQVYADDVLSESLFFPRAKREKPVVSFCGWAELETLKQKTKFFLKNASADMRARFLRDPHSVVRKQGIYFRKKAIEFLEKSPFVETEFIKRDFFSVNKRTIKRPRGELREEYLRNIMNSDFVLAPKGDGNFSIRFYEALALGRIPVLVDTDCPLPLQGEIDYRSCIVRVPHTKIREIDKYILDFYNRLDTHAYIEAQKKARALFVNSLRFDVFLKNTLTKLFPE